jgi:uncharacterized protein (UPF0147 family)
MEIKDRLHDPHWREVILLLLGSLNKYDEPPTLLVERILEAGESDKFEPVLHRHLYLAARALADRVDVAAELHRRMMDALLDIARTTPEWERDDAFTALSWLEGDRYAAEGLLALAHDLQVDEQVRVAAAEALGRLGRADEAAEVLLALARDPHVKADVRRAAASALGQLGRADEAAEVLLALVHDPQVEAWVRCAVASALGQLGRVKEATEILLTLASEKQVDTATYTMAVMALNELSRTHEQAWDAAMTLIRRKEARNVGYLLLMMPSRTDEKARGDLLALARDSHVEAEVRSAAASALGQLGCTEEKVLDGLLALARDPQVEARVCRKAYESLKRLVGGMVA